MSPDEHAFRSMLRGFATVAEFSGSNRVQLHLLCSDLLELANFVSRDPDALRVEDLA